MKLSKQIQIWLIIAFIHLCILVLLLHAPAVHLSERLVTAQLTLSEQAQPNTDNAQVSTSNVHKIVPSTVRASPRSPSENTHHTTTVSKDGIDSTTFMKQHTALNNTPTKIAPTELAKALEPTEVSRATSETKTLTSAFAAPTHIGGHLHNPLPIQPILSIEAGEQGVVRLRVHVQANGHPANVSVAKSSGFSRLDRAARETVLNQYRFNPATQGGKPIPYHYEFDIRFKIKKAT